MLICFQPLSHRRNAAIMGLVCRLLAGEGRGNLQTYCPQFCDNQIHRRFIHNQIHMPTPTLLLTTACLFTVRFPRRFHCLFNTLQ